MDISIIYYKYLDYGNSKTIFSDRERYKFEFKLRINANEILQAVNGFAKTGKV